MNVISTAIELMC